MVVGILCVVIALVLIFGLVTGNRGMKKAVSQLNEFKKVHNDITAEFVSFTGFLAFSHKEKKLYVYSVDDKSTSEIPYEKIVKYECKKTWSYEKKENIVSELYFWACAPEYKKFISAGMESDNYLKMIGIFDVIIRDNFSKATKEYAKLMKIPSSAVVMHVTKYTGHCGIQNSEILKDFTFFHMWKHKDTIYFSPTLEFDDFGSYVSDPSKYKLMELDKKNVVAICEVGCVENRTVVTGGGGGGSSIKGAIVGGILAGEAGAIIGSRKTTNPITVTSGPSDGRRTILTIEFDCCESEITFFGHVRSQLEKIVR